MSNCAYLYISEHAVIPEKIKEEYAVCAANYMVPIFWYALYDKESLVSVTLPCDDGTDFTYDILSKELDSALDNLNKRRSILQKVFGESINNYLDTWLEFVNQVKGKMITIETSELALMENDPKDFSNEAIRCLESWNIDPFIEAGTLAEKEKLSKHWELLLKQAGITKPEITEENVNNFLGYGWTRIASWEPGY